MKAIPTIRDVARKTGFSIATVSRALRGNPRIPESTHSIIRKAAQAIGYQANPMLAALAAHRWQRRPTLSGSTLALLADGYLEGVNGMVERAAAYGYRTEIFQIKDYPSPQRLSQMLFSRGILGLVVGQIGTPGFSAEFDWSRFVAVAMSEGRERPPVNLVMPNHFLAIQQGWDHARALGYRRIGLVMFEFSHDLDCRERHAAFLERQLEVPEGDRIPLLLTKPIVWSLSGRPTVQEPHPERAMKEWLNRYRPDVVLGFNDLFRWIIKDAGWRVPKQVAFISLWISKPDPGMTGLALALDETGRRTIDWLDLLLRSGERGIPAHSATMQVDMIWQDGKTAPGTKGVVRYRMCEIK